MSSVSVGASVFITDEEILALVLKKSKKIKRLYEAGVDFSIDEAAPDGDGFFINLSWENDEDGA
jgi:hypothetical protein